MIRGEGLDISFGERRALKDVSVALEPRTITGIVGPNGSGKTTLLRALAGMERGSGDSRTAGRVLFRGRPMSDVPPRDRARHIAYVGSNLQTQIPLRVGEAMAVGQPDGQKARAALLAWDCLGFESRWLHSLSGGELQRVALAAAWARGPEVFLLDEAFAQMDLGHQALAARLFCSWVSEGERAVAFVSHDLHLASAWADRWVLLKDGKLSFCGTPADAVREGWLARLYPGAEPSQLPRFD